MQAHNRISLSGLYNKSRFLPRIGGLSACMGNVVHNTYTTGTRALPDTIRMRPRAYGPRACAYILGKALEPVV